ncbi:hypothetical protein BDN67DRAFT_909971, partial [Paxillus ammoniavirescens]
DSEGAQDVLSFQAIEKLIGKYTGVEPIEDNMCPQLCLAFTGLLVDLKECPMCHAPRWDQGRLLASQGHVKQGSRQSITIPLGPQLQSHYCDPQSAHEMRYLHERTQQVLAELCASGMIPAFMPLRKSLSRGS